MGYSMLSFQPAAHVGDARRWREDYGQVSIDAVWAELEKALGHPIPWQGLQFGDPRCNRTAWGLLVGDRWVPVLDPDDDRDLATRDRFLDHFGGVAFTGTPPALLAVKIARVLGRHPGDVRVALGWAARTLRRAGGLRRLAVAAARRRVRPMTFEVHSFMDAAQVAPAWELMQRGEQAQDPQLRATQERLAACTYTMAHPETGQLVPACAQHSVLDVAENAGLRRLLPLTVLG
jgi:hypothetical protein